MASVWAIVISEEDATEYNYDDFNTYVEDAEFITTTPTTPTLNPTLVKEIFGSDQSIDGSEGFDDEDVFMGEFHDDHDVTLSIEFDEESTQSPITTTTRQRTTSTTSTPSTQSPFTTVFTATPTTPQRTTSTTSTPSTRSSITTTTPPRTTSSTTTTTLRPIDTQANERSYDRRSHTIRFHGADNLFFGYNDPADPNDETVKISLTTTEVVLLLWSVIGVGSCLIIIAICACCMRR